MQTAGTNQVTALNVIGSPQDDGRESQEHNTGLDLRPVMSDARIMMVDDEPTTIDVVQMYLEDAGYGRFITTVDSSQALETMVETLPDVILLDLMMPDVDGFEILNSMRDEPVLCHLPVIVLTSSTDSTTKLKALELGASDFLAKPVDPSELILRVRNTLAAKAYQDRLTFFDTLTGLPNRRMFLDRLDRLLERSRRNQNKSAVLHLNLDRFKQINDTLGQQVGDSLLNAVAERIESSVRSSDLVAASDHLGIPLARIGGDEFTVVLADVGHLDSVTRVATRIQDSLTQPFFVKGEELFATVSTGIAVFPDDGADKETLLKHCGVALSHAKATGKNNYQFYSKEMNARASERLNLENQLRKALDRDELQLFYQPKVDVQTNQLAGAEALLRWQHPQLGLVSPDQFIPIAEETGLIVPIGEWIAHTACTQCRSWRSIGQNPLRVSVNVSGRQFNSEGLVETIRHALATSQLPGESLVLEITESVIMSNPLQTIKTLESLKALGLAISIDDFGTGYSSLSYLKQFPLDELKIDRSFVTDVCSDSRDAAIVKSVIAMAKGLGLKVVAEGVENQAQKEFLLHQGCDEYQGFLFGKPIPASEFPSGFYYQGR